MNKIKMIIIAVFQWLKCYRISSRLQLWFKPKSEKECKHCCLVCKYFDFCSVDSEYMFLEYKGYTIYQSIFKKYVVIFDENGKISLYIPYTQMLSEDELRQQIELCIKLRQDKEVEE